MALLDYNVGYAGAAQVLAAPTTSETIPNPGRGVILEVTVGATATVVTIVRPGNDPVGNAVPDTVSASLTSTTRKYLVDRFYDDGTGNAAVTFSQVTGVTAAIFRTP